MEFVQIIEKVTRRLFVMLSSDLNRGHSPIEKPIIFYFEKKNGFKILHVRYQKNTRGVR